LYFLKRLFSSGVFLLLISQTALTDPLNCDMSDYQHQDGLSAHIENESLIIAWQGDAGHLLLLHMAIQNKTPVIQELSVQLKNGESQIIIRDAVPEFRVVSGLRRVTQQQTEPLEELGVPLTAEKLNEIKWDAFWDAPLYISQEPPLSHQSSIPAAEPFANHPGMPRDPDEIVRATATYNVTGCEVKTDGARIQVMFPGVTAGLFSGYLQIDVFKGSNLIRQTLMATTEQQSVAFKFDAGLRGVPIEDESQLVWRDVAQHPQNYKLGGPVNDDPVTVFGSNRLIAAEMKNGAIAAFPPPHSFYWARESEENLGYGWYRKDSESTFAFGVRQAEHELNPEYIAMTKDRLSMPFSGFDSIDPRMERVPNDLRDPDIRQEYLENHIKWFLNHHEGSIDKFKAEVQRMYGVNGIKKETKQEALPLFG